MVISFLSIIKTGYQKKSIQIHLVLVLCDFGALRWKTQRPRVNCASLCLGSMKPEHKYDWTKGCDLVRDSGEEGDQRGLSTLCSSPSF